MEKRKLWKKASCNCGCCLFCKCCGPLERDFIVDDTQMSQFKGAKGGKPSKVDKLSEAKPMMKFERRPEPSVRPSSANKSASPGKAVKEKKMDPAWHFKEVKEQKGSQARSNSKEKQKPQLKNDLRLKIEFTRNKKQKTVCIYQEDNLEGKHFLKMLDCKIKFGIRNANGNFMTQLKTQME